MKIALRWMRCCTMGSPQFDYVGLAKRLAAALEESGAAVHIQRELDFAPQSQPWPADILVTITDPSLPADQIESPLVRQPDLAAGVRRLSFPVTDFLGPLPHGASSGGYRDNFEAAVRTAAAAILAKPNFFLADPHPGLEPGRLAFPGGSGINGICPVCGDEMYGRYRSWCPTHGQDWIGIKAKAEAESMRRLTPSAFPSSSRQRLKAWWRALSGRR